MNIRDIGKLCDTTHECFVLLYADDILLISASVTSLQNLLFDCEKELNYLDMLINSKKSCYYYYCTSIRSIKVSLSRKTSRTLYNVTKKTVQRRFSTR